MNDIPTWLAIVGIAVPILISLVALGFSWRSDQRAAENNRISQEARDIARKTYEADNLPHLSIETNMAADFGSFMAMMDEQNYVAKPPSAFEPPIPIFIVSVKNEGKLAVRISNAGIELVRTGAFMAFPRVDVNENHPFRPLPLDLAGWQQFEIPVSIKTIQQMLNGLEAQKDDRFGVRVIDSINRPYVSSSLPASIYLEGGPMTVTVKFPELVSIEKVGEEEYFPDGIFPGDLHQKPRH